MEEKNKSKEEVNKKTSSEVSPKSWIAVFLLFIFLGGFGVYRLYVDKVLTGIAQFGLLVLSFIFIMLSLPTMGVAIWIAIILWLLVDFILILIKRFKDGNGLVIKN